MAFYTTCARPTPRRYHGMSPFFPRSSPFGEIAASMQPLFRMIDEELTQANRPLRAYQPRFDVREESNAYHLQGELPGIAQENINIEFKDEHTLVVSGRTVRESKQTSEDTKGKGKAIDEASTEPAAAEETPAADNASETGSNYHKPTVEDEFVDVASESQPAATPATTATEVAKPTETADNAPAKTQDSSRYWVSERSVGEFHRSFTFAGHIDQDAVTANLKDGVLNIVVPKAAQKEPRKIQIA